MFGGERIVLESKVLRDPAEVDEPVEFVLLSVKAHQTAAASGWFLPLCREFTVVAVLQNGVEHVERVAPLVGPAHVLPVVVHCSAEAESVGHVRAKAPMRLVTPVSAAGSRFAALMNGSGIRVEASDDFVTEQWRKLCLNAVAGIMAATGRSAEVFRSNEVGRLAHRLAIECVEVGRAEGAKLDQGFAAELVRQFQSLPRGAGSSILSDRLASRPLEWDARNGVIVRLGARHGIPTPVSDVLVTILAAASGDG